MTLKEAIKHCEDVADYDCFTDEQRKCSEEHRQLADWLRELKERREKAQLSGEDATFDCVSRQEAITELVFNEETKDIKCEDMRKVLNVLKKIPFASPDLSTFSDKLWKIAYERGKAEGQTEAWEFAIDAYYGTTKEQKLFECLTFTQAKTERGELRKCKEKNNAGQIFVELANHINRCINDAVKKTKEGEEE